MPGPADGTIGPYGKCPHGSVVVTAGRVPHRSWEVIAVSTPVMPPPVSHPRKPLLGLRRKPGRLALAMFRMPLRAYRHDAGWLLGHTFLEFVHWTQERPAVRYVVMVLRYDATHTRSSSALAGTPTGFATSAPDRRSRCGLGASRLPRGTGSCPMKAFDVAVGFRREHPRRMRLISTILGWGDLRDETPAVRDFILTYRSSRSAGRRPARPDQIGMQALYSAEVQQRGYTAPSSGNHQHPSQPRTTPSGAASSGRKGQVQTLC